MTPRVSFVVSPIEVLLVAAFVVIVVLFRLHRSRAAAVTEPSCGKCGYIVIGLTTQICPECGSDLNVVGIIHPGNVRSWSRRTRLVLWTLIVLLLLFWVLGFAFHVAGGIIHVLLVIALVLFLVQLITGRRTVV